MRATIDAVRGEEMAVTRLEAACARVGAMDSIDRDTSVTAAELYERHLEDVFRYVLHRVRRPEEAEDITADVFAAAFTGLSRFRGHCAPRLWLLSIARRKVI